jgi:hypothetical protein
MDDDPLAGRKALSADASVIFMFCTRVRVDVLRRVKVT